jgi:16S rRNA (adenine1518-N6/adenine1519-N6)-dimethyltransferase
MAQSKGDIQALLAEAGSGPRHRFGQNFMIDQNLVRLVAEAGEIAPGDVVIEVGPGTGTLTEELLARVGEAGRVVAVEIDRDLAALLRQRFAAERRFELIEGDALAGKHAINAALRAAIAAAKGAGKTVRLVANLPYNIASPLVIELLIEGVELLAFTVQKEVGERLGAGAGDEAYGPLTVMAQLLARVELLRTLPPQAFWPAPKIESALVRVRRADQVGPEAREIGRFVQQLFAARRKTLRKAITQAGYAADALLATTGIEGSRRVEELAPERILALWRAREAGANP